MKQIWLTFGDQIVALNYPASLRREVEAIFTKRTAPKGRPSFTISVEEDLLGRFTIQAQGKTKIADLARDDCLLCLIGEVVEALITELSSGVVLHSGAVAWKRKGILLPGKTGSGKSCLSAWLAERGFDYLTDECVVLLPQVPNLTALRRPIVTKNGASTSILKRRPEEEFHCLRCHGDLLA